MASSIAATAKDALWGSTPIKTFMRRRTSVSVGLLCHHHRRARRAFRLRVSLPHLFRATPSAAGTGGTQAENEPTRLVRATGSSRAIPETGTLGA